MMNRRLRRQILTALAILVGFVVLMVILSRILG
ncbi:MAG: hypothetical protein KatS3mg043_0641 [Rhodothermaceae bacterium]|nr:MAG: hypothetical protein KatS3mg043_0641 [Rhodothermaceae bacterium]